MFICGDVYPRASNAPNAVSFESDSWEDMVVEVSLSSLPSNAEFDRGAW